MFKANVVAKFGGVTKTAKAMRVSPHAVRGWGDILSPEMALRAFCASNGELELDPFVYEDWPVRGRVCRANDRRLVSRKPPAPPAIQETA